MDLRSGKLVQVLAQGEKYQYGFYFPDGAPVEEALVALNDFQVLFSGLAKNEKTEETSNEEKLEDSSSES